MDTGTNEEDLRQQETLAAPTDPTAQCRGNIRVHPSKLDFLLDCLGSEIDNAQGMTRRMQRLVNSFRIAVMLLSAASTAILGWNAGPDAQAYLHWSRNFAFVLGTVTTFLAGLAAFWNVESFWLTNKVMLFQLKELRDELGFAMSGRQSLGEDEVKKFFQRYRMIRGRKSEYWAGVLGKGNDSRGGEKAKPE